MTHPGTTGESAMYRGDPAHTGVYPDSGASITGQLAWKFKAPDWVSVYSSPAVSGGTVYVSSFNGYAIRGGDYLSALDAATGTERWKFTTGGPGSSPAISGGLVYVGMYDGYLHAVDAASGAERWKFKVGRSAPSSPVVSGGVVYMGGDDGLYALDAASGAKRWKFTAVGLDSPDPAVAGGLVYAGSFDGHLYAVDATSGKERWSLTLGDEMESSPAVSGGVVYAAVDVLSPSGDSDDGYIYALDAATGAQRWKFETGGLMRSSPAVSGGLVYVGTFSGNGNLYVYAVDAASGAERWKFRTGGVQSSPSVSGGVVYVGSEEGNLYALDAASGTERWEFKTGGSVRSSPVVSGGLVYVGSEDGYLYAVNTGTAAPMTTGTGVSSTATTMAPPPETTTETSTTAGTGDTESPIESTAAATPDIKKYVSDSMAWFSLFWATSSVNLDILGIIHFGDAVDVTTFTAADLQVAEKAMVHLHELSNLLHSIKAPPAAAGDQRKLVAGFDAEVALWDKELQAMRNKDQAGVDAARRAIGASDGPAPFDSATYEWLQKYGQLAGWGSDAPTTTTLPKTQYEAAMMAWIEAFRAWADIGSGFEMTVDIGERVSDPAKVAGAHGFGDQLRAIQPPAAMAAVHQKLVDAFDACLAVLDKRIAPGAGPDPTALQNAETAYEGAMEDWLIALFPAFPLPMGY